MWLSKVRSPFHIVSIARGDTPSCHAQGVEARGSSAGHKRKLLGGGEGRDGRQHGSLVALSMAGSPRPAGRRISSRTGPGRQVDGQIVFRGPDLVVVEFRATTPPTAQGPVVDAGSTTRDVAAPTFYVHAAACVYPQAAGPSSPQRRARCSIAGPAELERACASRTFQRTPLRPTLGLALRLLGRLGWANPVANPSPRSPPSLSDSPPPLPLAPCPFSHPFPCTFRHAPPPGPGRPSWAKSGSSSQPSRAGGGLAAPK